MSRNNTASVTAIVISDELGRIVSESEGKQRVGDEKTASPADKVHNHCQHCRNHLTHTGRMSNASHQNVTRQTSIIRGVSTGWMDLHVSQ